MNIKRILVLLISGTAAAAIYVMFSRDSVKTLCTRTADGLTLPGVFFTGFGALKLIARTGVYDIFGYAVRSALCLVFSQVKRETYIGYVNGKDNMSRASTEMFLTGIMFLAAALIVCCFSV